MAGSQIALKKGVHEGFQVIQSEFFSFSLSQTIHLVIRISAASILGGFIGFERECRGKAAGLRTQVLVAGGTAFLAAVPQLWGMEEEAISRLLEDIITGVGFLGAGAILKHPEEGRVEGLTTAASIWFTAAIGIAAGLGLQGAAIVGTLMGTLILWLLPHVARLGKKEDSKVSSELLLQPKPEHKPDT